MSVFVDKNSSVIVQGITGHQGMVHTLRMLNAGTDIRGGVNPKKAGQTVDFKLEDGSVKSIPVFANCEEAVKAVNAQVSVIFVPPRFAKSAMTEAIDANIRTVVCITEGIPVADTMYCVQLAQKNGTRLIGPNCPGLATFAKPSDDGYRGHNLGIIPDNISSYGPVGLVSKSGTLTYQLMEELSDIGFTAAVGVGGDPVAGTSLLEAVKIYDQDPETKLIVMIGEIGGNAEQEAAHWIKENGTKPVVAYIAGFTAPEGKQMGHAGAIISGGKGTAKDKKEALEAVGIKVGSTPAEAAAYAREIISGLNL